MAALVTDPVEIKTPAGETPAGDPGVTSISALVDKHKATIDVMLDLPQVEQEKFFRAHGIDPFKLVAENYPDLIRRSDELTQKNEAATKKARQASVVGLLGAGIGISLIDKKYFSGQRWIKTLAVTLGSLIGSVASYFATTKMFTRDIRVAVDKSAFYRKNHPLPKESERLTTEARDALKRELAVILENDERNNRLYVIEQGKREIGFSDATKGGFAAKVEGEQRKPSVAPPKDTHVQQLDQQNAAAAGATLIR